MKIFEVSEKENGLKLDKYIMMKANVNETFLFMMLRKKQIKVNDIRIKDLKLILKSNDKVSLYIDDSYFKNKDSVKLPFEIIYEDDNLMIVDKPKHMMVHSKNNSHNNLVDIVTKYLIDKGDYIPSLNKNFRPSASNRLDTNTEGLVIISKNIETLKVINKLIESKEIDKYYLAVCLNKFDIKSAIYRDYLIIDSKNNKVKVIDTFKENAKEIITEYKVLKEMEFLSLIEVHLLTGRLHQIRAHMAYHNHPIVGDNKYGNKLQNTKLNKDSQELISYKLVFNSTNLGHLEYLKNKEFKSKISLRLYHE